MLSIVDEQRTMDRRAMMTVGGLALGTNRSSRARSSTRSRPRVSSTCSSCAAKATTQSSSTRSRRKSSSMRIFPNAGHSSVRTVKWRRSPMRALTLESWSRLKYPIASSFSTTCTRTRSCVRARWFRHEIKGVEEVIAAALIVLTPRKLYTRT